MIESLIDFSLENWVHDRVICMPYIYPTVEQMLKNFLFFQGPKFYNCLDSEIINTNSIYSFKKTLKNKIINNYE